MASGRLCLNRGPGWRSGAAGALLPGLQDDRVKEGPETNIYVVAWTSAQVLLNRYVLFYDTERIALMQFTKYQKCFRRKLEFSRA